MGALANGIIRLHLLRSVLVGDTLSLVLSLQALAGFLPGDPEQLRKHVRH